jgi:adenine-specific DNA-methyltransferase
MASQTKTYDQKKLLGQDYTPPHIVEKILNHTGFYIDYSEKKILDPACGDGRFLIPIARHIIQHSSAENLKKNLEKINGWDIDPNALALCRANLDELVHGQDVQIDWNLKNLDALTQNLSDERFDLIVGNPPYIRIQHLPNIQRKYIQSSYSFCKNGSTDAYIAFFQLATTLLSPDGVCGFITPNSYFVSETGKILRTYFERNKNLIHVTNFGSVQLFENTGTYSAISVFGKERRQDFYFEKSDMDYQYTGRSISYAELSSTRSWNLSIDYQSVIEGTRLGDLCRISVGITTLSDSLYLFSIISEHGTIATCSNKNGTVVSLEKALLKPIIKGSKLKTKEDPIKEYILFPYQKDETGKHRIIPEHMLQNEFPACYQYFTSVKSELELRDNGKENAVAWYAFGRSQALDSSFGRKIIFSPMNRTPNFVLYENPECTLYSGYFIKYDGDYEKLLSQLNSQRMTDYIASAGRDFQGGYKGYNKKVIENFIVTD